MFFFSEQHSHSAVFDSTDEEDGRRERHHRPNDVTDGAKPSSHVRSAATRKLEKSDHLSKKGEENTPPPSARDLKNKFEKEKTNTAPVKVCDLHTLGQISGF